MSVATIADSRRYLNRQESFGILGSGFNLCGSLDLPAASFSRLARLYADAQELLASEPEFQQLGRLWAQLNSMSDIMDALRKHPERVAGQDSYTWLRCLAACWGGCFARIVCNRSLDPLTAENHLGWGSDTVNKLPLLVS